LAGGPTITESLGAGLGEKKKRGKKDQASLIDLAVVVRKKKGKGKRNKKSLHWRKARHIILSRKKKKKGKKRKKCVLHCWNARPTATKKRKEGKEGEKK